MAVEFYVYAWKFRDTGNVFYVGKGKGRRYKETKDRNDKFIKYVNKFDCHVEKLAENLSESDAYQKEIELIAYYKSIGQCDCNFTIGGDAPPTHYGINAPNRRAVVQLTLDGKYVRTWDYIHEVEKTIGVANNSIVSCCKQKTSKSAGGFLWVYESEYNPNDNYSCVRNTNAKKILQYSMNGDFIKEWDSAKQVCNELGYNRTHLCNCCKGNYKSTNGYKWIYKQGEIKQKIELEKHSGSPVPVLQFDLLGNFIQRFNNATDAVRSLGKKQKECSSVINACKGVRKTAYNYKWKYEYDWR